MVIDNEMRGNYTHWCSASKKMCVIAVKFVLVPNILRIRWNGRVAGVKEMRMNLLGTTEGETPRVVERIILKRILEEYCIRMWTSTLCHIGVCVNRVTGLLMSIKPGNVTIK